MRIIPVIDLMHGQVVRGVAGRRSEYRPIASRIVSDARPTTVARALVDRFGFDTVYVADLDAIMGGQPNTRAWQDIHGAGLSFWLDAGAETPVAFATLVERLQSCDVQSRLVVGLESWKDPNDDLWLDRISRWNPLFSLDLQAGIPKHSIEAWSGRSAAQIARSAHARGFGDFIVLDLSDVGTDSGTRTRDLCRQLLDEMPAIRITAGGGVRGVDDLKSLAAAGCHAALVASALHDGRLTPEDVRSFNG